MAAEKPEGRLDRLRQKAGEHSGTLTRAGREVLDNLPDILLGGGFGDPYPEMPEDGAEGDRVRTRRRRRWRTARAEPRKTPELVIEPRQPGVLSRVREFWRYRRLTPYFGMLFLEKLYRKTILGWVWIPLRPVISVGTRVLVFGGFLGAPSEGIPYLLFFLVGFATWQLFSYTTFWATRSIELGRKVLQRMYVPRLVPLAGALVPSGVNFALYTGIATIVVFSYLFSSGTTYLVAGPGLAIAVAGFALEILLGLSIGCFTSVMNARAKDARFAIGYFLSFWFFLSPVIYPLSGVPGSMRTIATLNPMSAPLEMVRIGLFGAGEIPLTAICSTVGAILVIGTTGMLFFNRAERIALDSL